MRPAPFATALLSLMLLAVFAQPALSDIRMDKAHLKRKPFKIYDGHLSAAQKLCLQFALKQWAFYDEAPVADDGANRNESNEHVMAAGKQHLLKDAKDHARSSRSMSAGEKGMLEKTYGGTSPFKGGGDPTKAEGAGWFTSDEAAADISIEPTGSVPSGGEGTYGWMQYGTTQTADTLWKGGLQASVPAALWMRDPPADGKTWCYPTDTNGDGWITNADAKCPIGTVDYYAILKHELGHYFSFVHDDMNRFEVENPPPVWEAPHSLCSLAMSAQDDEAPCVDAGSEFSQRPGRVFFASNRPGGFGGRDLWFATWDATLAAWAHPTNCGPTVNTAFNETDPAPALGGALLYFASDRSGQFDLYVARTVGTAQWDSVAALPSGINTVSDETGPYETWGRLFFASNRPGGFGGFDLYSARVDTAANARWFAPTNLGATVNGPADDRDPDVTVDEGDSLAMLVFASDRPGGAPGLAAGGDFDLYRSAEVLGSWGTPINLGAPINTAFDETGPSHGLGNDMLYFACNRPDGHGGQDAFESRDLRAHPVVAWNGDALGPAGTTVPVEFEVLNQGRSAVTLFPAVSNSGGWPMSFNPTPLLLGPGLAVPFQVDLQIPSGASPGATSVVTLQVQAPSYLPHSNHAYARASANAGAGDPRPAPSTFVRALPNPFRHTTRITFSVATTADVRLEIFDAAGRRLRTLWSGAATVGVREIEWDGRGSDGRALAGNVFLCRLTSGHDVQRTTVVRMR